MREIVLVTGATGNVGRELVANLPSNVSVRAGVRSVENASDQVNRQLSLVAFDFLDESTFANALSGVVRLFLVRPPQLADSAIFERLIVHAKQAGVRQIVFLSIQGVEKMPYVPHAKIEEIIRESGIDYVFLRAGFFMQNLNTEHQSDIADDNELFLPAGNSKTAFIDVRDIGAVAAKILSDPLTDHQNTSYTLTGSELLDYYEVADILTRQLGRNISYPKPSPFGFLWQKWRSGEALPKALVITFLYTTTRFGQASAVHPDTENLLGRAPISFEQYAQDYRHYWE